MGQWFYAEGNRQQRGPLASEELIALYQSSRIAADTLVWRDGMAQWQPLREVAEEIGLVLAPPPTSLPDPPVDPVAEPVADITPVAPVAVPPDIPLPPPVAAAPAAPRPAASPVPASAKGMSGCAIAAIIGGACLVVLVAVLGILAAIALPAYQEYTLRAKTTQAVAELASLKVQIAESFVANGRCPVNDDDGFLAADGYASGALSAVHVGRFDNSHCGIEAELTVPGQDKLDGKLLWLDFDPDQQHWECTSDVDDKYLPLECRG
ncbi:pilin [Stenotrophomonas sp.]|uniref:pilin n=1 Tax=Stenotrophomonas sp. TaxID=69392 RepID=UPI002FCBD76B